MLNIGTLQGSFAGLFVFGCVALSAACGSSPPGDSGGSSVTSSSSGAGVGGASTGSGGAGSGTGGASSSSGAGGGGETASIPADLLDLVNWKLTLPISAQGDSSPLEIKQPELATYSIDPYFHLNASKDGVVFQAHAGGATTSNSGYPRSELREMTNQGSDLASWSTTSGTHTMTIKQAITHLPAVKPHVVAGQIHDASDDLVMIRLEDKYLFVEGDGNDLGELDADYALGTTFTIKIVAENGAVQVYYNDMNTPKVDVSRDASGCYFKAGAYTQSNPSKGDEPTAYGEVIVYDLSVTHQ
jgi:poly(beta-D-mannuronate) lyase